MIIISQDKKIIVENLNLGIKEPGEYNRNYVIYNTELGKDLGEYQTEEKAKSIVKELKQKYKAERIHREIPNIEFKEILELVKKNEEKVDEER